MSIMEQQNEELYDGIRQGMNSTAHGFHDGDAEIFADPVLGRTLDLLMDDDMELDRRCMFVDSSACRAMTNELAGFLRSDPYALPDLQNASDAFLFEEINPPSFIDNCVSSASLGKLEGPFKGLCNETLRYPLTKELAELLESNSSTSREHFWRKNNSFISREHPRQENVFIQQNTSSDSWIKHLRLQSVEGYDLPQATLSSTVAALSQLSVCASSDFSKTSINCSSSSVWKVNSSPSSASELPDCHHDGLHSLTQPYLVHGREELFKLLQRSVVSHVGKVKHKEAAERYALRNHGPGHAIGVWSFGEPVDDEEGTLHDDADDVIRAESSDVIALLTICAQAIARNDITKANRIVREIRKEATPFGDGKQRLAHYFMEALVARISGTGGCLYTALNNRHYSASEMLKTHQLRIEKSPFVSISHFFSNQTIANTCQGASRLHVIDYGILYGFQWPSLIQTLAARPGGPPRLRITGIDFPQPGIKPSERVDDTGRRLSEFARSCGVPFEYHAFAASKWEDIQPSSLSIRHDEVVVVNCMLRLRHLLDETVKAESPRKKLLARIRSIQPKVFVEAEVNAGYNAPCSFMARFQEALAHFHNVYDAIDSCVKRDHPDRCLLEQEIFDQEILNVVACEGLERVERAEHYKYWHWWTQKAGFEMLALDQSILNRSKLLMQRYHEDYSLVEDDGWLIMGWRGRLSRCISAWQPVLL
ncbi:hypothetical protein O6H91_11G063000 [Diphasiastrum complanatum]|uniref:Uncharacterized protein n=1 Tax=Diphasiastrum complanatum TaxID=34168 RepID=A0ACC2CAV7_DIPCM|nr:hypothetical protein O6H91_11G063000 [Diphasiastrum complanatum]